MVGSPVSHPTSTEFSEIAYPPPSRGVLESERGLGLWTFRFPVGAEQRNGPAA